MSLIKFLIWTFCGALNFLSRKYIGCLKLFIYAYFILNNGKWEYTIMQSTSLFFLYAFHHNILLPIVSDHAVFSRQIPFMLCLCIQHLLAQAEVVKRKRKKPFRWLCSTSALSCCYVFLQYLNIISTRVVVVVKNLVPYCLHRRLSCYWGVVVRSCHNFTQRGACWARHPSGVLIQHR